MSFDDAFGQQDNVTKVAFQRLTGELLFVARLPCSFSEAWGVEQDVRRRAGPEEHGEGLQKEP